MKRIGLVILVLLVIAGILGYNYLYQDHRDIATTDAVGSFSSEELMDLFTDDDSSNDINVLDQVILVNGNVTLVNESNLILDEKIFIELDSQQVLLKGTEVTVKGRCIGYDDLLEEIKIDQATIQ